MPEIVVHCACVDYLLNPNKNKYGYKTAAEYHKGIDEIKSEYDNTKNVYDGVSVLEENIVEI